MFRSFDFYLSSTHLKSRESSQVLASLNSDVIKKKFWIWTLENFGFQSPHLWVNFLFYWNAFYFLTAWCPTRLEKKVALSSYIVKFNLLGLNKKIQIHVWNSWGHLHFRPFIRCFCPKWLTVIHTYIRTLMVDTLTCSEGEPGLEPVSYSPQVPEAPDMMCNFL